MRKQLDSVLEQKIANPSMELYTPHSPTPSPSSQLIQAIIDLITTEDYSRQVSTNCKQSEPPHVVLMENLACMSATVCQKFCTQQEPTWHTHNIMCSSGMVGTYMEGLSKLYSGQ